MCLDTSLYAMIYKRKSFHLFRNVGYENLTSDEIEDIYKKYRDLKPLYSTIRTAIQIVPTDKTTCKRQQEYCVLIYSEIKDNYLQNVGYMGEQLDLYLASKNIGTLWYGAGKPDNLVYDGLSFVIMFAIAKVDDDKKFRKDMFKSKRKPIEEIWKGKQIVGVSDIVRYAPSACNSQPWIVEHNDSVLRVYRYKKPGKRGIMPKDKVSFYNQIDVGIFLCFLELCLQHNAIQFEKEIFYDSGNNCEKTIVAEYTLGRNN